MNARWTVFAGWMIAWTSVVAGWPAAAQPPRPQPKVFAWDAVARPSQTHFGILGEIARPGTYVAPQRDITLQELVEQAGGPTASAAATVTIVRHGRALQSIFLSPVGRDLLQPDDIVVVDAMPSARPASGSAVVWLGLVGVADRPVVVPIRPELARLDRVTGELLGQSRELARAVKVLAPSQTGLRWEPEASLPSGTVLVFDRSLLVERNLPEFPEAQMFRNPTTSAAMPVPLPPDAADAAVPSALESPPAHAVQPTAQPRGSVHAFPVPFPAISDEATPASPASIPAPGSRLQMAPEPAPPSTPQKTSEPLTLPPQVAADERVEIFPAPPPPAPQSRSTPATAPEVSAPGDFSLWQLLGLSGAVACVVGLAIAVRRSTDPARIPVFARTDEPTPAEPQTGQSTVAVAERSPSESDDLTDLFAGKLQIITEPVQFPKSIQLQQQRQPGGAQFRLDARQTLAPPAHHLPKPQSSPAAQAVAIDPAASGAPQPHFARPSTKKTIAARAAAGELQRGTMLERALTQLDGGRAS